MSAVITGASPVIATRARKTGIEWATETWEPVGGCTDASEGCAHCYAREGVLPRMTRALPEPHRSRYLPLIKPAPSPHPGRRWQWTGEMAIWADRLVQPLRWKKPRQYVFVCSQSDLFHERRPNEHIAAVFGVMAACPQSTFIVLTKRARRMREWFTWVQGDGFGPLVRIRAAAEEYVSEVHELGRYGELEIVSRGNSFPLDNVILMVTAENQLRADERIPDLLACPAVAHGVSYEPALGPVDFGCWLHLPPCPQHPGEHAAGWGHLPCDCRPFIDQDVKAGRMNKIGWVVAGAESGPGARPAELDWFRSVRDQCVDAGVPFFLKQAAICDICDGSGDAYDPEGICPRCAGNGHIGKVRKGNPALDDRVWAEVPHATP